MKLLVCRVPGIDGKHLDLLKTLPTPSAFTAHTQTDVHCVYNIKTNKLAAVH